MLRIIAAVLLFCFSSVAVTKDLFISGPVTPISPIGGLETPAKPVVALSRLNATITWPAQALANRYYVQPIKDGVAQPLVMAGRPPAPSTIAFLTYTTATGARYQFKVKACSGNYDDTGPIEPPIGIMSVAGNTGGASVTANLESETCSTWSALSDTIVVPQSVADADFVDNVPVARTVSVPSELPASAAVIAVGADFSVSNQGAATYNIPLVLPAGFASHTPQLSLSYSSLADNGDAGVGWSLSAVSSIGRCQKVLEEDGLFKEITFTNADALCLGGEKLRLVSGNNLQSGAEYRLDKQPEVKVLQSGTGASSYFTLYRPGGEALTFGGGLQSRQIDSISGMPYSWLQSTQVNLFGQTIEYQYQRQQDHAPLLQYILYAGNKVELVYENRPDPSTHYYLGNKLIYNSRIADIIIRNHSNQAVRSYHLGYKLSGFSDRSLLQTVQMCNGSANGFCSQPTTLNYSDANLAGLLTSDVIIDLSAYTSVDGGGSGCNSIVYSMSGYCSVYGLKLADVDSDGNKELLISSHKGETGKVLVFNIHNNGVQFNSQLSKLNVSLRPWRIAVSNQPVYYSFPWQLTDADADGNLDFVFDDKLRYDWNGDGVDELSPGMTSVVAGYASSISWSNPDGYEWLAFPFGYHKDRSEIPLDINGDGLIDRAVPVFEYEVIYWPETGDTSYTLQEENWVYEINRSEGSIYTPAPKLAGGTALFRSYRNIGDVNGDGHTDLAGSSVVSLNNGKGFGGVVHNFTSNIYCLDEIDCLHGLADINGDGKDDMLAVKNNAVYWNRSLADSTEGAAQLTSVNWGSHKLGEISYKWEDWDGDDQPELIFFNHKTQKVHIRFDRNTNNEVLDKLISIENGLGKDYSIEYRRLNDPQVYQKGSGAAAANWGRGSKVRDIVSTMPVVAKVTEVTGLSQSGQPLSKEIKYFYKGMKTQAGGRGALGFAEVITEDVTAKTKTVKQFRQDPPYNGLLNKSEIFIDGQLAERTSVSTWWNLASNNGQSRFVAPRKQQTDKYYLNADYGDISSTVAASTTVAETLYEMTAANYPRVTSAVTTLTDKLDSSTSSQTVSYEYSDEDIANWRIQRPTRTVTTRSRTGQLSITQTQDTVYNSNGSVQQVILQPESSDASVYLQTFMRYDSKGNLIQQTQCSLHFAATCGGSAVPDVTADAAKVFRRKIFNFDAAGRYLSSISNGVFTEQSFHNFNKLGQAQEVRFNQYDSRAGQREFYRFDSFGERYFSYTNQGSSSTFTKQLCSQRNDCPANAALAVVMSSPNQPDSISYIDFQGNKVREALQLLDGRWSLTDTLYDAVSRPVRVSKPYINGQAIYYDTLSYDAVGRKDTVQSADELTTRFSYYAGNTSQYISGSYSDEASSASLDRTRQEQHNGRGEVTYSSDSLGNNTYFTYTALGLPYTVTGVDNAVTTLSYDTFGRRTGMNDPDKGLIRYGFNALGEDIRRTSPDGIVKTLYRNAIGQTVRSTTVQGASTLTYLFNYGNTPFLQQQSHNGSVTSYGYDSFHRPSTETYQLDNKSWSRSYHYDEYGRLFRDMDIAGNGYGQQYQYAYGHVNRIFEVKTGHAYYRMQKADAYQNLTKALSGANVQVDRDYDAKSGRLTGLVAGYGAIQHQYYRYDQLGNLRYRSNLNAFGSTDLVESFGYDVLNRLETVTFNGVLTQRISYSDNGNILTKSDVENGGVYQYGTKANSCGVTPGEHAVSQIGTRRFCYDARGNQTHRYVGSSLTRRVDYTAFDKPHTIWSNQGESRFNYDASEKQVKRTDKKAGGDRVTYYVGGHEAIFQPDGTSEIKRYIRDIAIHSLKSNGTQSLHYVFNDHLGSGSVITDANGNVVETASFDAFGKRRNANSWQGYANPFSQLPNLAALLNITQKGYTGHIQVDHAAVIHMGGRIYDPELGRFMQADPIVQDPRDAQSLNRYSYVYNNPLSYTDPTGYECQNQRDEDCASALVQQKEDAAKAAQTQGSSKTEEVSKGNQSANLQNAAKVASGDKGFASFVWGMLKRGVHDTLTAAHEHIVGIPADKAGDPMGLRPQNATEAAGAAAYDDNALVINLATAALPGRQAALQRSLSEVVDDVTSRVDLVINETLSANKRNITSQHTLTADEALQAGQQFLGGYYTEIGKPGSGVFRSADGARQFRMDSGSLSGSHAPNKPHVHLEMYKPDSTKPIVNNHIPFVD